jgi:hypothetical protein
MPQNRNTLEWFKKNIDLQLEDVELELQRKHPVLFFDTADIQDAVIGMRAFYGDDGRFLKSRFERTRALVNALISAGWLGQFHLLMPHLAEFHKKAQNNFRLSPITDWNAEIREFLTHLKWLDDENHSTLDERSEVELQRLFETQARNGLSWFKAIYSMTPWHRKLGIWIRTGLLNIDQKPLDYGKIVDSRNFGLLKKKFDEHRPSASINNVVDTTAICQLMDMVEKFNQGAVEIPRFFLPLGSSSKLSRVITDLDWWDRFECNIHDGTGNTSSVFRDEDYFLYKITFRHHTSVLKGSSTDKNDIKKVLKEQKKELSRWQKTVTSVLGSLPLEKNDLYTQTLTEVSIDDDLKDLIDSLQRYSVLDQDRFKNPTTEEFRAALRKSKESKKIVEEQKEIYENTRFRKFVNEQWNDKIDELSEDINDFTIFTELYHELDRSIRTLQQRLGSYPGVEKDDFFTILGLIRYGFPEEIEALVGDILSDLISGEDDNIRSGCARTIRSYLDARKAPAENSEKFMTAAAVLLAVHGSRMFSDLLKNVVGPLPHYSLDIAYCELLLRKHRTEKDLARGMSLLGKLEKLWKTEDEDPNLSIGLAYLHYWAWRAKGGTAAWELEYNLQAKEVEYERDRLARGAIYYAGHAYESISIDEPAKKAYALNQFVFCVVECGDLAHLRALKERKDFLLNYQNIPKVWQFRFDDTLARYYFRRAFLPELSEKKTELINRAMDYERDAKSRSDGDAELDIFHGKLTSVWEGLL